MENEIENRKDPTCLVWLNGSRVREGAWGGDFYLEVRYEGAEQAGYLDIGPGETLTVTIDGQPQSFSGMGSVNTRRKTDAGTYVGMGPWRQSVIHPSGMFMVMSAPPARVNRARRCVPVRGIRILPAVVTLRDDTCADTNRGTLRTGAPADVCLSLAPQPLLGSGLMV